MILQTLSDIAELQYNYARLSSHALDLRNIASSLENYNYTLTFTTSSGALVDELQQTATELKGIAQALAALSNATASVVQNAADEMAKAEIAATIQLIGESIGGR